MRELLGAVLWALVCVVFVVVAPLVWVFVTVWWKRRQLMKWRQLVIALGMAVALAACAASANAALLECSRWYWPIC